VHLDSDWYFILLQKTKNATDSMDLKDWNIFGLRNPWNPWRFIFSCAGPCNSAKPASLFQVCRGLACGFLGGVYEAMRERTAREPGFWIRRQLLIEVFYRGKVIGEYAADLLVNDLVLVELKAARMLCDKHEAQLLNYLKANKYGKAKMNSALVGRPLIQDSPTWYVDRLSGHAASSAFILARSTL
jgi:GxxExxY protein